MTQSFCQASPEVLTPTSEAWDVRPMALLLYLHRLLLFLARVPVRTKPAKPARPTKSKNPTRPEHDCLV